MKHKAHYPSGPEMARNVVKSMIEAAKNPVPATNDVFERRIGICKGCDYFDDKRNRCKKCGCLLAAKLRVRNARCPVGKW